MRSATSFPAWGVVPDSRDPDFLPWRHSMAGYSQSPGWLPRGFAAAAKSRPGRGSWRRLLGPRAINGAELVRKHYAPFAVMSGPLYQGRPQGELTIDFLVKKGYPRDLFQVFATNAHSTIDEAGALRGELERRHAQRVLLVTSNYHSRRAAIVLGLFCPGSAVHFRSRARFALSRRRMVA